jgi:hypothetical protein
MFLVCLPIDLAKATPGCIRAIRFVHVLDLKVDQRVLASEEGGVSGVVVVGGDILGRRRTVVGPPDSRQGTAILSSHC